jgi:thymidylate kinase
MMLSKVRHLIGELNTSQVRYCHWKSNVALDEALSGLTDIDLLIHREDANSFRAILSRLGFRPAACTDGMWFPSTEHYYGLDEETGLLVHVHAYFRVITGESLTKNYRLPIEPMLLQNTREQESVRLPLKSAELVSFTLRMMLKHTSLVEIALLARDWGGLKREIEWLTEGEPGDRAVELVGYWLPSVDRNLFSECVKALQVPAPLWRRIVLGLRLRRQLRVYARQSSLRRVMSGIRKSARMLLGRLGIRRKKLIPASGGTVIAFVAPEATGKTTLLAEVERWLGESFEVSRVHAGKPASTIMSLVPNLFVPALRMLFPRGRSTRVETQQVSQSQSGKSAEVYPILFGFRSVLLAYDRRALLKRAFAKAANGTIILCDRYPSSRSGAVDSPQLHDDAVPRDQHPGRHLLARIEKRLYEEIPPPDLVLSLSVPVEVAILRNRNRGKEEPEDYVRYRHARNSDSGFEKSVVHRINTDQPLEKTVLEVKKAIWNAL